MVKNNRKFFDNTDVDASAATADFVYQPLSICGNGCLNTENLA